MEKDCKVTKTLYSTLSQYTRIVSQDINLAKKYMRLSREALEEDEVEIKIRKLRYDLEEAVLRRRIRKK